MVYCPAVYVGIIRPSRTPVKGQGDKEEVIKEEEEEGRMMTRWKNKVKCGFERDMCERTRKIEKIRRVG